MPTSHLADNPLEILRRRLEAGVKATPLCIAVIGWLCNDPTDPFIAAIKLQGNQVTLRLSNEPAAEPVCSLLDFLDQIRVVCEFMQLGAAQTSYVVTRARDLLE